MHDLSAMRHAEERDKLQKAVERLTRENATLKRKLAELGVELIDDVDAHVAHW
jgi:hypothetical protein